MGAWGDDDFGPGDDGQDRKALLADALDPGETIIWRGGPIRWALVRRAIPRALFGLLWTAFVVMWMAMVARNGVGKPKPGRVVEPFVPGNVAFAAIAGLWLLPFGIYTIAGPYLAGRKAARTAYALTDRRALVIEPGLFGRVRTRSYAPEALALMTCNERADGVGDLVFERVAAWSGARPIGFVGIARVREVESLVRKTSRPESPSRKRPPVEPAIYRASVGAHFARIVCLLWGGLVSFCLVANGVILLGFSLVAPQKVKVLSSLREMAAANGLPGPLGFACAAAIGFGSVIILGLAGCLTIRYALAMPTRITIDGDGRIAFHGWRRTVELRPEEILSVATGAWYDPNHSQVTVRHAGGKMIFFSQFPDFRGFLARLKALNPAVEIRGF
jgi:hypothetical protein